MGESSFGVALHLPADQYQQSTRAAKYGFLFVALTFLTYFVFALLHPVSLHPIHYLLVGAALCLFYLLQLAIAEHLGFGAAYAIAAAATVALVAAYSSAVLDRRWAAGLMAALLGALYGFLYVLLRAEDFALLLGGLGLFTILGAIMFLTRRTRWS
jgi:inner membrane protein